MYGEVLKPIVIYSSILGLNRTKPLTYTAMATRPINMENILRVEGAQGEKKAARSAVDYHKRYREALSQARDSLDRWDWKGTISPGATGFISQVYVYI